MHRRALLLLVTLAALVPLGGCEGEPFDSGSEELMALSCVGVPDASSPGVTRLEVDALETWDPFGFFGTPIGEYYDDLGRAFCPGAELDDPLDPCPGESLFTRGVTFMARADGTAGSDSEQYMDGWVTVVANANHDENGNGREWGTWYLALDSGGTAQGTFVGARAALPEGCSGADCTSWVGEYDLPGCGTGADGEKVRYDLHSVATSYSRLNFAFTMVFSGEVVLP